MQKIRKRKEQKMKDEANIKQLSKELDEQYIIIANASNMIVYKQDAIIPRIINDNEEEITKWTNEQEDLEQLLSALNTVKSGGYIVLSNSTMKNKTWRGIRCWLGLNQILLLKFLKFNVQTTWSVESYFNNVISIIESYLYNINKILNKEKIK